MHLHIEQREGAFWHAHGFLWWGYGMRPSGLHDQYDVRIPTRVLVVCCHQASSLVGGHGMPFPWLFCTWGDFDRIFSTNSLSKKSLSLLSSHYALTSSLQAKKRLFIHACSLMKLVLFYLFIYSFSLPTVTVNTQQERERDGCKLV